MVCELSSERRCGAAQPLDGRSSPMGVRPCPTLMPGCRIGSFRHARRAPGPFATQRGFTYLGLLLAVALAGVLLAGLGTLWSTESRRAKEDELLFIGEQFHTAITAYFENTPTGQRSRFPPQLADLLDDKRWPVRKRHLRDIYIDPLTGSRDWVIIKAPDGGVLGVASPATGTPLRRAHFIKAFKSFEEAGSYADWRFAYALPDAPLGPDGKPIDPFAPKPPTLSNAPNASEVLENGPQAQPLPTLP